MEAKEKKLDIINICEEKQFKRVFDAFVSPLRNYIYYKFGDAEKAADAAQEAFVKLWENCDKVSPDKAKAYLFTVANNLSLNQVAHQKVVLKYEKNHRSHAVSESPEFQFREKEFEAKLNTVINNLSEAQRTAFLLNRIEGMKYSEIALHLDISVKAVEKRIHKALIILRKEIGDV
ncbi:MAG: sigma-70 family RNA polymerase sigma factor [Bacteroidetes bacterium]|nr:sigma-70 family RNA polymerase sigma factor [Bacteroidota bacterium]